MVTAYCRGDVHRSMDGVLNVRPELFLRIDGLPGANNACADLGLGAEDGLHPNTIIRPPDPGAGETICLVEYESLPGLICSRGILLEVFHVANVVVVFFCKRHVARVVLLFAECVDSAMPVPVGVDSPEPPSGAFNLPIRRVWIDAKFVADSLVVVPLPVVRVVYRIPCPIQG